MNNKVAVLVVLYPTEESYVRDYANSLREQSFKDFDLIIVNDKSRIGGNDDLFRGLNVKEYKYSSSISKNREYGIKKVKEEGYDYLVFTDIDDFYQAERIEKTIEGLQLSNIVVNDLNIVSEKRQLQKASYFSETITKGTQLDLGLILQHNLFGFSNTGVRTKIVDKEISFPEKLRIVDWYFYTLLLEQGEKAEFINEALSDYRQHLDNLIGIGHYSLENFQKLAKLKYEHFCFLTKKNEYYRPYKEKSFEALQLSDKEIEEIINIKKQKEKYPLWWEIVNI